MSYHSFMSACIKYQGSAWMTLSKSFIDYCIWGWDNLPRTVLMYYPKLVKNIEELKHSGKEKSSAVKKAEEGAADLKKKVDELTKSLEEHDKEYQVKA
ncbi:structural maintenance of chromosomes protein 2-1-like isoform X1 [Glycine soja]|uniref:structural maintenance of chromosomes protein 2-1-like n=1 Tax=Glycine soja TaxID=3848 RepID=UPI000E21B4B6|nr:structural maintenance of chromosomes protein 2-1-like [Glycine soja]XP_028230883.1 structural maintenance of chromosomes protein 2-1-like [Glycine soja]XP_028240625.1 structural maintenance of chromosomes protein 2-1-like isoform X1 [Glycine soja]|eukprot:XP_025983542.1 structural maintenance of chromosomes protein 2-1 isoform X1 [Glycine max]